MPMNIVLYVFLYLMIAIGAILLILWFGNTKSAARQKDTSKLSMVILVRNQQDITEGLIRNFCRRDFVKRVVPDMRITVIDMGSNDETWQILTKLSEAYEYIEILKEDDREKIFTNFG